MYDKLVESAVQRIAIERPTGILVNRLLEAGITVIAVHPDQLKATPERYSMSHAKSDRVDVFVLAALAGTDTHQTAQDPPHSDASKALRALSQLAKTSCMSGLSWPLTARPAGSILALGVDF